MTTSSPLKFGLKATLALIDRAGLSPKTAVELGVSVQPAPYEQILDSLSGVESGSRAAHRRSRGIEDTSDSVESERVSALLAADPNAPIDAEIVSEGDELIRRMRRVSDEGGPMTPDEPEHGADDDSAAPNLGPLGPT